MPSAKTSISEKTHRLSTMMPTTTGEKVPSKTFQVVNAQLIDNMAFNAFRTPFFIILIILFFSNSGFGTSFEVGNVESVISTNRENKETEIIK